MLKLRIVRLYSVIVKKTDPGVGSDNRIWLGSLEDARVGWWTTGHILAWGQIVVPEEVAQVTFDDSFDLGRRQSNRGLTRPLLKITFH